MALRSSIRGSDLYSQLAVSCERLINETFGYCKVLWTSRAFYPIATNRLTVKAAVRPVRRPQDQ